jgi:hypothetical protein
MIKKETNILNEYFQELIIRPTLTDESSISIEKGN